jgi:hypothetical protein
VTEIVLLEKSLSPSVTENRGLELPDIAWRGSFKKYRDMVGPTTEAADTAHYATFLPVFGCTLGRRIYVYHAGQQFPNTYTCIVGRSGLTRKDTAASRGRAVLEALHCDSEDDTNPSFKIVRGIRSYEGLLDELGGERKIRLVQLGELLSLFAKASQQSLGNIIPALTELYDCPSLLNPPIHQQNITPAREPFLSIMAGTTKEWLQKALTERDIYGGFANRWLYFCGPPKDAMPNPPKVNSDEFNLLVRHLNEVRLWAAGVPNEEITVSAEAAKLFENYYCEYYRRCQQPGLIPTLIVRIQDFIFKIALLYAADDRSIVIEDEHMKAAIEVGLYLESSVSEVFANFGESRGRQSETKVLDYLKSQGHAISYRDVYRNLNLSGDELDSKIKPLISLGLIRNHYEGKKRMLEAI